MNLFGKIGIWLFLQNNKVVKMQTNFTETLRLCVKNYKNKMIEIQDFLRYSKQMQLPEIGESGQLKIKQARVLVIGAGGLGCPVLQYLAAVGVGNIGIVDFDKVEVHNLHRQILYLENQVGAYKSTTAKAILENLNPNINIQSFEEKLTLENAKNIIANFDYVVDGTDNFTTRYIINDTCMLLNKPLIYGSIFKFEGQIAVFNHKNSKNLRDIFPEPPNPEDVPNCSVNGVLGTLTGIIGTMMAQETLKLILELPTLYNELLLFDTLNLNFTKLKF